jgi:Bacterial membrane protein YfhO
MLKRIPDYGFWRIAAVVFAVMALINYLPMFSGKVPFPRDEVLRHSAWNGQPQEQLPELIDIVAMFYPFRALLSRASDEHALPLWNPYIMSGAPFQANAQSALFAPLNILYYVLPLKAAWTVNLVIRLFLAALFMALFTRSIGGSHTGSILSGILFALCGFTIQWQGMSNGDSGIWLPLMCYAVHRLHTRPDRLSIAIAALAFSMPLLSGHPETAAHSALAAGALALFLVTVGAVYDRPGRGFKISFLPAFVAAGLLALGLASVQVLPTVEWLGQLGLQVEAPQPVLDRHQGQGLFSRDITKNPSSAGVWIPEGSAYVGMLGLLAACLAPFHSSRRYVWFLVGIAIVAAAVAFGIQPVRWIVVHLPVIKAMKNGRLTLVVDFALAALAGLGVSAIGEQLTLLRRRARRWAMILIGAAFVVLCFCVYEVHLATLTPVELFRSPSGSLLFLAGALAILVVRLRGVLTDRSFSVLICGLAGLEMLSFSYGYLRFASIRDVFPPAPVFDFLRAQDKVGPFRVAKDRFPIPHDAGIIYGFEAADGYDLTTERTRVFTSDLTENREDGVMFLAENILGSHDRRFDMLNAKYLMVSKPGPQFDLVAASDRFVPVFSQELVAVFENRNVLPRAFSVPASGVEVIREMGAQLARLKEPNFDPERSVIFSEAPAGISGSPSEAREVRTRVDVVDKQMNAYRLHVESNEPTAIVISQTYYPGWKARMDGVEIPVYPVDVALTGLMLPSGSHDVRLFFQPSSFRIGVMITLAALVISVLLLLPLNHLQTHHPKHEHTK